MYFNSLIRNTYDSLTVTKLSHKNNMLKNDLNCTSLKNKILRNVENYCLLQMILFEEFCYIRNTFETIDLLLRMFSSSFRFTPHKGLREA